MVPGKLQCLMMKTWHKQFIYTFSPWGHGSERKMSIRELVGVWYNRIDAVINWHSTTTRYYLTNAYKLVTELVGVWYNWIDAVINWHSATTRYYLTNTYKLVTELYLVVNH